MEWQATTTRSNRGAGDEIEGLRQPLRRKDGALLVVGIVVPSRCRRPGEVHRCRGQREVMGELRLAVEPFGKVGVVAMHEDDGLILPRVPELAVDGGHERPAIAQARGFERDEIGARVDDATRKGDRARLPLGRNRDDEPREAERRAPTTVDRRARDRGAHAGNQYRHRRAGPDRGGVDRHRAARAAATAGKRERREKAEVDQYSPHAARSSMIRPSIWPVRTSPWRCSPSPWRTSPSP